MLIVKYAYCAIFMLYIEVYYTYSIIYLYVNNPPTYKTITYIYIYTLFMFLYINTICMYSNLKQNSLI